jgi:hypothetical protein
MQFRNVAIFSLAFMLISLTRPELSRAQSTVKFSTLSLALQTIRQTYKISTGFDATSSDRDQTPITVDFSDQNIGDVFDSIILQKPMYTWSFQDGVYDIYPKSEAESISGVYIVSYSVTEATYPEASDAIARLPEVQSWLSQNHVRRNEIKSSMGWSGTQKISLTLNKVPLRNLLDQLTKKSGVEYWNIIRWGDKMQFIAIIF